MAKLAAKTYGDSLFELALEEGKLELLLEEAKFVQQVLTENEDLVKMMTHPKIGKEEKQNVIENIFKSNISDEMTGFLVIVIKKGRFKEMKAILSHPYIKPEIDREGVASLILLGPARKGGVGVFKGIEELLPGEYAVFSKKDFCSEKNLAQFFPFCICSYVKVWLFSDAYLSPTVWWSKIN